MVIHVHVAATEEQEEEPVTAAVNGLSQQQFLRIMSLIWISFPYNLCGSTKKYEKAKLILIVVHISTSVPSYLSGPSSRTHEILPKLSPAYFESAVENYQW
jgi:hypothetical protein